MRKKKIFVVVLIFGSIIGGFYTGFFYGKLQCKICPPEEIDLSLFWETFYKLKEKFIFKEKIDPQKMIYGAISGMVKSLEDPYTEFFEPQKAKKFMEEIKGEFEGIGIEIGMKKNQLTIIAPLEGTPAYRAGLKAGDKIIKINDTFTADLNLEEAVNLIRGPKGTKVILTILREGWETPKEFEIVRDVILVPSIKFEIKETSEGEKINYIKIYYFNEKTLKEFKKVIEKIKLETSPKIILDLRSNPGGYLEVAKGVADIFLKRGSIVVIEEKIGGERKEYKTNFDGQLLNAKVLVLVDKGTASGAEILAGALRDNRGIMLIGEKTFGKGSIQTVESLSDGSSLKITIAHWLTPKGEKISEQGLEPDIKIEDNLDTEEDEQLQRALEIIREI